LTRAVYRVRADLLPRVMSPSNVPIAQLVPGASRCASVKDLDSWEEHAADMAQLLHSPQDRCR
jgi:hypothetical protein